jgi:hypothetical protein
VNGVDLRWTDGEPDKAHRGSQYDLILENVLSFPIQLVRDSINPSNLFGVGVSLRLAKTAAYRLDDESSSIIRYTVNSGDELVWKVKLNGHRRKRS